MLKIDFLRKLGLVALASPLAITKSTGKAEAKDDEDALVGLWEASITSGAANYGYVYSISRGAYIATGNVDENLMNFKFSPTMGTYVRSSDRSYEYRERGYVFDMKGKNVGTFTSAGTLHLGADGNSFSGPGRYTQYDLQSKVIARESFTVKARRLAVQSV